MFINVKGSSGFSAFLNEQLGKHKTYHIIYEDRSIESLMEKLKLNPAGPTFLSNQVTIGKS